MRTLDEIIINDSTVICENIDDLEFKSRDKVAQNMLSYFRNLVEHIAIKIYSEKHPQAYVDRESTKPAMEYLKTDYSYYFLRQFHKFLQISRSHYTPDNDGAERLVLKYYEYLVQIKKFMKQKYDMDILHNLDKFPLDLDTTLQEYYEKIVEKLQIPRFQTDYEKTSSRYYVYKCKSFFVDKQVYYEITLIPANNDTSKFNRIVVFSQTKVTVNYAIKVDVRDDIIEIDNKFMPVKIMVAWSASIRPCELKNFAKIFNINIEVKTNLSEYKNLMTYLTVTGLNLVEILESSDRFYVKFKTSITNNARSIVLCNLFDEARKWIREYKFGSNVIRYLLYCLSNRVIKTQLWNQKSTIFQGLYLSNGAAPFERIPFNFSLRGHNPRISDLLGCISPEGREDEFLARRIKMNADNFGKMYTNIDELEEFKDIDGLISVYNEKIDKHKENKMERVGDNVFIRGYEENTQSIITGLIDLTNQGVDNYATSVNAWLYANPNEIDSDEKREILKSMFVDSSIAMIYGAAGTGKSTLINHISKFWNDSIKVYIANTNPAVENMRRKVNASKTHFLTIKKYLNQPIYADVLFIDECSMVNNKDMIDILDRSLFKLLVLVGDIYQIEAIQFGNWFSLARNFVPTKAQYELTAPYRTKNRNLLDLWSKVRKYNDDIDECLNDGNYSSNLDDSIFEHVTEDEIVLCLNYDGLYGINSINRFLQNANSNRGVSIGMWMYKIGDPILFNESSLYGNVLYNNLKGCIVYIEEFENEVFFSIEIDRVLNGVQVANTGLELLPQRTPDKSIVKFSVRKHINGDDDDDENDAEKIVPFQIAYAVSMHKAQGLEYDSVKIVITKEVDELISHNIFYTAITRAKENLKIYWTAESQKKILEGFKDDMTLNDTKIFSSRTGLRIVKRKKL